MPPPSAADVAAAQSPRLTEGDAAVAVGLDETDGASPAADGELAGEHPIALSARIAIPAMTVRDNRISYLARMPRRWLVLRRGEPFLRSLITCSPAAD
jgi:hypothetical protein